MTDLAAFLLARIAEDDDLVRPSVEHGDRYGDDPWTLFKWDYDTDVNCRRVLAECEAKRRIVALDPPEDRWIGDDINSEVCEENEGWTLWQTTLRLLALPYADHPDYRDEWKPT